MKLFVSALLVSLMLVAFAGCKRERYQMGNVRAPKTGDAPDYTSPDYTVKADPETPVQTR